MTATQDARRAVLDSGTGQGPLVHWMTLGDGKLATFDEFGHDTHDGWT
ncbi:MAG: hypothetical protein ACT4NP_01420 [Pseudonocardiales bacterium]